jgi:hypothetical protein
MDARVSRLEEEMGEVRAILHRIEPLIVRIDAQIPYLATKAEVESVRRDLSGEIASVRHDLSSEIASVRHDLAGEIASARQDLSSDIATLRTEAATFCGEVMTELAYKPSRGAIWAMGIALFTLPLTGIAIGSVYLPYVAMRLHVLQ